MAAKRHGSAARMRRRIVSNPMKSCGYDLYRSRRRRRAVASSQQAGNPRAALLRIGTTFDLRSSALHPNTMHQPVNFWQIRFYFAIYLVEI
jgi:hypothetical protein